MPACIIARVQVTDAARYAEYMKVTPGIIEMFGGRFIARGGETETLEGEPETSRVVLIEFPSLDEARIFYRSPEYKKTKVLREGAATAKFVAVEGWPPL
jgi:uncharacterized protein (DUF1330 family)